MDKEERWNLNNLKVVNDDIKFINTYLRNYDISGVNRPTIHIGILIKSGKNVELYFLASCAD